MRRQIVKFMVRYPLLSLAIVAAVGVGSIALLVRDNANVESDEPYNIAAADEPLFTSKYDDRMLELEKEAVDNAFRQKAEDLIRIWFLDETGQPARFMTGARNARKKYIEMQNALEKREKDLETLRGLKAEPKK